MPDLSDDRLAVLEVMVEMLTARDMAMQADQDQALADYRDVAIMGLSRRRSADELDDAVAILDERLVKIDEHLAAVRRAMQ
ncbi:MAG: hypothetical protein OXG16_09045 [Rhodospirillales bacterium]|nr:hypothetical protein [Rhodospirillales bacterium]